jgi:hypothetical protein
VEHEVTENKRNVSFLSSASPTHGTATLSHGKKYDTVVHLEDAQKQTPWTSALEHHHTSRSVCLNCWAVALYQALTSIILGPRLIKKEFTRPQSHTG